MASDRPSRVSLITHYIVTNLKLAANAIPFKFANGTDSISKTTATYEKITDLSVTITVERNCTFVILFSAQCAISDLDQSVIWRVFVNTDKALPATMWLQPPGNANKWSSVSYTFFKPNVSPGEYTVYAQWYVGGAQVGYRAEFCASSHYQHNRQDVSKIQTSFPNIFSSLFSCINHTQIVSN